MHKIYANRIIRAVCLGFSVTFAHKKHSQNITSEQLSKQFYMRKEKKATALLKILCYSKGYEGKTMNYKNTIRGIFKDRPNRFIAHVQIGDQLETVHVKNTADAGNFLFRKQK